MGANGTQWPRRALCLMKAVVARLRNGNSQLGVSSFELISSVEVALVVIKDTPPGWVAR